MAAPSHAPYNTAVFWNHTSILDLFFPYLTYEQAKNLMLAVGLPNLPLYHYTRCRTFMCDDSALWWGPAGQQPPTPSPWVVNAIIYVPQAIAPCGRTAYFTNHAVGMREPSLCLEPHDAPPQIGFHGHPHPHPNNYTPRVCTTCKFYRAQFWERRLSEIKFAVCKTCRKWAVDNMQQWQDDCACPGSAQHTNGSQNNEPAYMHLCRQHERRYWHIIWNTSYEEIDHRLRLVRKRTKKRGHGWTQRKGQSKVVKTPWERRKATQPVLYGANAVLLAGPPLQTSPRCFCGNQIPVADLPDYPTPAHPGPVNLPSRVRNCAGCNQFVRRW